MSAVANAVRSWLDSSPYARRLGIETVAVGDGQAELRLPYRPELATLGDIVDGGQLSYPEGRQVATASALLFGPP